MNANNIQWAQWLDRQNGYHDFVVSGPHESLLGMVDTTISNRARSFVRRADGTWKLEDHASLADAKRAVEDLAQV